jgi:hypothetical protein
MSDPVKSSSKTAREAALEKALRDNLRRRKAAGKETPAPETQGPHEKASGNEGPGA